MPGASTDYSFGLPEAEPLFGAGFAITPLTFVSPITTGDDEVIRIQMTVSVLRESGTTETLVYRYAASSVVDAYAEGNLVALDPGQATVFHYVTDLTRPGLTLDTQSPFDGTRAIILPEGPAGVGVVGVGVSVLIATTDQRSGMTTMYEGAHLQIDAHEVAIAEKMLGYRCRTLRAASLDSSHNPIAEVARDGQFAEEGPSFSFSVEVLSSGGLARLSEFLEVFSPNSVAHASDIIGRMQEAEVFCRLRARYHLTCYQERCFSFIHWYRVRDVIAANGGSSWILSFLTSVPEADTSVGTADSGLTGRPSRVAIFQLCFESVSDASKGDHSFASRMRHDTEFSFTLAGLWRNCEYLLLCRLSALFGPEPFLFDPKSRFQQTLSAEISSLLADDGVGRTAVEFTLHGLVSSAVVLEAWGDSSRLVPARLSQLDGSGACSRVIDRYKNSPDPVAALLDDLPSSPKTAMMAIRPDHGAAFTRQQLRSAFSPREPRGRRRFKALLCDAYACASPFMVHFELFLMSLGQKKGLVHQSPVLWRRAVDMPDSDDWSASLSADHPQAGSSRLTPERAISPSVSAPRSESRMSGNIPSQRNRSVSFVEKQAMRFQSARKASDVYRQWASSCTNYSAFFEKYMRATSASSAGVLLWPQEVAVVDNKASENIFRANLASQTRAAVAGDVLPPTVRRVIVPMTGSMVDCASRLHQEGCGALSPFGEGAGRQRWIVAFSDPSLTAAPSGDAFDVISMSADSEVGGPRLSCEVESSSFSPSDWHFGSSTLGAIKFPDVEGHSVSAQRLFAPADSDGDGALGAEREALECVFAVCDVLLPSAALGPTQSLRLSIRADELCALLENSTPAGTTGLVDRDDPCVVLGGELRSGPLPTPHTPMGSFLALYGDIGAFAVVKALVRCELCRWHSDVESAPTGQRSTPLSGSPAPSLSDVPGGGDALASDSDSDSGGDASEGDFVVGRPIDAEGVGKVGALFRSASGASAYLDDGRSEEETEPAREYPARVRGVGGAAVPTPTRDMTDSEALSSAAVVRRVSGMDRYRKDGYAGVVPRRVVTPTRSGKSPNATSRSRSAATSVSPSIHRRRASPASTANTSRGRHLSVRDAAAHITAVDVSAVLGNTDTSGRMGDAPLTLQQELMLVRSVTEKRDYAASHSRFVQSVAPTSESELAAGDAEGPRRDLRMSYDAKKRRGMPPPKGLAENSNLFGLGHVRAQPTALTRSSQRRGGALSAVAMGIFSGAAHRSGSQGESLDDGDEELDSAGAAAHSHSRPQSRSPSHYFDPSMRQRQSPDRHTLRDVSNGFGAPAWQERSLRGAPDSVRHRAGGDGRGDTLFPSFEGGPASHHHRSVSRPTTEMDEHGVPYRMYDEISRSPSVVAAAHYARPRSVMGPTVAASEAAAAPNARHPFATTRPIDAAGDADMAMRAPMGILEERESSRPATVLGLFAAAGGVVGAPPQEVGRRSQSVRRAPDVWPPRPSSAVGTDVLALVGSAPTGALAANYIVDSAIGARRRANASSRSSSLRRDAAAPKHAPRSQWGGVRMSRDGVQNVRSAARAAIESGWVAFRRKRDSDAALAAWTRVVNEFPFTSEAAEAEGIIADVFEVDAVRARGLYEKAARMDHANHHALFRLALTYESEGDTAQASRVYSLAANLGSGEAERRLNGLALSGE